LGPKQVRKCLRLADLHIKAGAKKEVFEEIMRRKDRAEEAAIRAIYRKYFG
jgi:hypothetical protein